MTTEQDENAAEQPREEGEELLTLNDAVAFLGTSKPTMYRWLERGDIKGLKVGKQWRFRKADLVAYMERGPVAVAAAPAAELDAELAFFAGELQRFGTSALTEERDGSGEEKVERLVDEIMTLAVAERSTDIHLEPVRQDGEAYLLLRHRDDGRLREVRRMPASLHDALMLQIKQASGMELSERRLPQGGRIHLQHGGRKFEMRVATMPTLFGEAVVMRVLDTTSQLLGLEQLGLAEEHLKAIRELIAQPNGILLAAGPAGSGRSTLLYSCLQQIAGPDRKTLVVSEYVEHILPHVTPIQIDRRAGLTIPAALSALARHDPDVILVGEIPDLHTARLLQTMALTGHLVLAPVHAGGAVEGVKRFLEVGVEPYLLGATVIGIVCQRLVRRICGNCREAYETDAARLRLFGFDLAQEEDLGEIVTLWRGRGCEQCRQTGYKGRTGLFEILTVNEEFAEAIVRGASVEELTEIAVEAGMRPLLADGLRKALAGVTTPDEVRRVMVVWQ